MPTRDESVVMLSPGCARTSAINFAPNAAISAELRDFRRSVGLSPRLAFFLLGREGTGAQSEATPVSNASLTICSASDCARDIASRISTPTWISKSAGIFCMTTPCKLKPELSSHPLNGCYPTTCVSDLRLGTQTCQSFHILFESGLQRLEVGFSEARRQDHTTSHPCCPGRLLAPPHRGGREASETAAFDFQSASRQDPCETSSFPRLHASVRRKPCPPTAATNRTSPCAKDDCPRLGGLLARDGDIWPYSWLV